MMISDLRVFAFVAAMSAVLGAPLAAQRMTGNDQPAEFPPASYTGRQYVDSAGCVFVRAGFDGAVTWVPRVARSRTRMCGFTPTDAGGTAASSAPVVADVPAAASPAPARQSVGAPPPVHTPRIAARPAAPAPAPVPRRVVTAPPAATVATLRGTCPGASPVSGHYINAGARCGPQAGHPGGARRVAGPAGSVVLAGQTLVAPPVPPVAVPKGFRPAWDDDRLNPQRGKQLLSGALQTALYWTQEVPRRLVDSSTGRDVTREYNYLLYPYTDYARQKRDLAGGQHIVVRTGAGRRMIVHKSQIGVSSRTGQTILVSDVNPTLSTKSVAPRTPAAKAATPAGAAPRAAARQTVPGAGHRFVQVGTFGVAANARRSAAVLQRVGLPARISTVTRGGRDLQVVLVGPFGSAQQAQAGLAAARRAGFPDAFPRN